MYHAESFRTDIGLQRGAGGGYKPYVATDVSEF